LSAYRRLSCQRTELHQAPIGANNTQKPNF